MNFLNRLPKSSVFAAVAGAGGFIANLLSEFMFILAGETPEATMSTLLIHTAIWSALICTGIVLAIIMLQNVLLRKPVLTQSAIVPLLIGGIIGGAIAGGLAQFFYSVSAAFLFSIFGITPIMEFLHSVIVRSIAWAMMGCLAAFGMSFCIPNLNRKWAMIGGLIGGVLGCIFFLIICVFTGDWLGRLIGMAILGACIGAMIGFVETVFRNVWLKVFYGPNESTQVNLGSQLVTVGSGRKDTVFVDGVGPNAGSFCLEGDKIRYTDSTGSKLLTPGSRVQIGSVALVILNKNIPVYKPKPSPNENTGSQANATVKKK